MENSETTEPNDEVAALTTKQIILTALLLTATRLLCGYAAIVLCSVVLFTSIGLSVPFTRLLMVSFIFMAFWAAGNLGEKLGNKLIKTLFGYDLTGV